MDLKISVEFNMSDFIERWGDDSLEQCIKDEIKTEVIRKVKSTDEYKAIVKDREIAMLESLDKI